MTAHILPVWKNIAAPCGGANGCPAGTNIAASLRALAQGDAPMAWRIMMETHPFRSVLGRVCYGFCEAPCNRGKFDSPISIQALEAAIGDLGHDPAWIPPKAPSNGKKVLIIGAGPAGLAAGWFLVLAGFSVEVHEAEEKAGGMMRYGIPQYRLDKAVLDREIDHLTRMGVEIRTGSKLSAGQVTDWLKSKKYTAALVATGAGTGRTAGFAGEKEATGGLDFLKKVNTGGYQAGGLDGKSVVVIGGGNVAMDAARSAVRLGAKSVTVLYRRTESQMPAHTHEVRQAREEGVAFHFLLAPEEYSGGTLKARKMKPGRPDASGRAAPEPTAASARYQADMLITAIGQVWTHWDSGQADNIFFAGDAMDGSRGTVIHAIASGKQAADAISVKLTGARLLEPMGEEATFEKMNVRRYFTPAMRLRLFRSRPEERIKSFAPFEEAASMEEAMLEAQRCFNCGTCVGGLNTDCDFCFFACGAQGAVAKRMEKWNPAGPFYESGEGCSACGKCWEDCPRFAVRPAAVEGRP